MILLRGPEGERKIRENVQFRFKPGEIVVGPVPENLTDIVTEDGLMVGNAVRKITKTLGLKHCFKCSQRQQRLNEKGLELQQKVKDWFGA